MGRKAGSYLGIILVVFIGLLFVVNLAPQIEDKSEDATDGVKAQGTLNITGVVTNLETVTLGAKTYTVQTVLTDVDGNVFRGVNKEESAKNLAYATRLGPGAGVRYAASTTLHPTVRGENPTVQNPSMVVFTAKSGGTAGNAIVSTETIVNATFGDTTLGDTTLGTTPLVTNTLTNALFTLGKWLLPVGAIVGLFYAAFRRFRPA